MAQQNFRTALNGFNREDVVHYIEYLNAQHTSRINQLNSELEFLRSQEPQVDTELEQVVEEQAARIRELFDRCQELEAQLEEAKKENLSRQSRTDEELEAYRRAERMERQARERAEQLYHQTNGALADATAQVDEAAAQISRLTDQVTDQLQQLQQALAGSKDALNGAAATMYTIRPGTEE